jgi:creatinine amidohydrolase/Fe(II)-dependent formamide hydrolase-like protein
LKPRSALIEELTLPELQAFRPEVVVIPVGSTEQHAYHLPYSTETWRVSEHCRRAAEVADAAGRRAVSVLMRVEISDWLYARSMTE